METNFPCNSTCYNFRNCRQEKVNTPDLNVKICCNKDQEITNTIIHKQCRWDLFMIWINWLYWTKHSTMLYLNGFCYFIVSFVFFWPLEFIKRSWCLSNICIICIGVLYSRSIRAFYINHKFGINSSRKNVNNICVIEIRYIYQMKYKNQKDFPFLSVLLKLEYNTQERYFSCSAFANSKDT